MGAAANRWTRSQRALVAGAALGATAVVVVAGVFLLSAELRLVRPRPSLLLLDRRGAFLGEVGGQGDRFGYWPPPDDLPERIRVATLETEDRAFYEHPGVHLPSVGRALFQNLTSGRIVSGASTIAMQVARLQHPGRRDLWHKAREALEALVLVREFGHEQVLRHYLTIAPYGHRLHGAERAARYYFDKPLSDLSWLQAAFLAGLPQAPGRLDPHQPRGLERSLKRAGLILDALHSRGLLDDVELEQALGSELHLVPQPRRPPQAMHAVLRLAELAAGRSGPAVRHCTLDLDIQRRVAAILADEVGRLRWRGVGNGAALVVDRDSGEVLAYVGSTDYFDAERRGAIDYLRVRRSPGSALKPFVYALALEDGSHTAASELPDLRVEYADAHGAAWVPNNISRTFLGPMLLRDALGNSRNIPALRALAAVGVERALAFLARGGVAGVDGNAERVGLGLALGGVPVTLEELVGLYGVLAAGGRRRPLRFFLDEPVGPERRLLSRDTAGLVAHILADPLARSPSFPVGSALDFEVPTAIKTGTSQGYRDAWAVAFSDRLLAGVWVGNHDWRRMNRVGGLRGAARPLRRMLDGLMPGYQPYRAPLVEMPSPSGMLARSICPLSGQLVGPHCPHRRVEFFRPGTEPVLACPVHREVAVDRRNGLRAGAGCPAEFVEHKVMLDLPARYAAWARAARLELAPLQRSPLCVPAAAEAEPQVAIAEPSSGARYVFDPDTPAEYATIKLSAEVQPAGEPIVFLVDDVPVARADYPHEARWSLTPGTHTIQAAMLHRPTRSPPVTITVR